MPLEGLNNIHAPVLESASCRPVIDISHKHKLRLTHRIYDEQSQKNYVIRR